uniref:Putative transposase is481 family n=1 Tax=Anopheles marajoara TaxID=58244 RepID=A0A2M4C3V5_9DIPT
MRPFSRTKISSASITVESRWAMQMLVLLSVARANACSIFCSVIESKLLVASSNTRMGEFFKMARAIATRCFSPPDSFNPRSPTCVSYCFGHCRMDSCRSAIRAASSSSACDRDRSP